MKVLLAFSNQKDMIATFQADYVTDTKSMCTTKVVCNGSGMPDTLKTLQPIVKRNATACINITLQKYGYTISMQVIVKLQLTSKRYVIS